MPQFIQPQFIQLEAADRVAVIRLNRPEKLNAWNAPMREEIVQEARNEGRLEIHRA